jgi:hypothetical protein
MKRMLPAVLGLTGATALGIARVVTVTPASHDFGQVAIGGGSGTTSFRVQMANAGRQDSVDATIAGPDAPDFRVGSSSCKAPLGTGPCSVDVWFAPKIQGPKVARLELTDSKGGKAIAALKGTGVSPVCTNRVVFCNYAHLYSGTFNWTSNLSGPAGSTSETVSVTITHGVAGCNGTVVSTFKGRSRTGAVTGTGLVAVEFDNDTLPNGDRDPKAGEVYRITVACPSPAFQATADEAATPSRPAELGDFFQQTYDQRITPPFKAPLVDLVGSTSYPAPDVDALNGVNGAVQVNWSLKRS